MHRIITHNTFNNTHRSSACAETMVRYQTHRFENSPMLFMRQHQHAFTHLVHYARRTNWASCCLPN